MVDVINLRLARKARRRNEAQAAAEVARARAGETKAEREQRRMDRERAARSIDGAKREGTP